MQLLNIVTCTVYCETVLFWNNGIFHSVQCLGLPHRVLTYLHSEFIFVNSV